MHFFSQRTSSSLPPFSHTTWQRVRMGMAVSGVLWLTACAIPPEGSLSEADPALAGSAAVKESSMVLTLPSRPTGPQILGPELAPSPQVLIAPSMSSVRPDYRIDHLESAVSEEDETEEDVADTPILQQGLASFYGKQFHSRKTANGERFDMYELTAAHPSLPFGTQLCVRNMHNGKTVQVRVNDRGPFVGKRVIDLSHAAAVELGMVQRGVQRVAIYRPKDADEPCERTDAEGG